MRINIKQFLFLGCCVGLLLFNSCEKEYIIYGGVPDTVSHANDMQPFYNAQCVNCHYTGASAPLDLTEGNSYDNIINGGYVDLNNPDQSLLYTKINDGGSMAAYANPQQREMTLKWIEQGANDN